MALVEQTPINFSIVFHQQHEGAAGVLLSPQEFTEQFLWGIPLCNPITKESISQKAIVNILKSAQKFVEDLLDLKLFLQYIHEQKDFVREEFMNWGYVKMNWFLNKAFTLKGRLNEREVLEYPKEWLNIRRGNDGRYFRNLYIVPNGYGVTVSFDYVLATFNQWFNFRGAHMIPNYWNIEYLTGFDEIPADIIEVVGKTAAVMILPRIEQVVVSGGGLNFGLASTSISMDGLSQSISKANGGNIFGQRIQLYGEELKAQIPQLKGIYSGITFDVC